MHGVHRPLTDGMDPDEHDPPQRLDDASWVEVIRKMDEVYSQLVRDEIELEQKNAELEQSQQFIFSVLSSMSDVLMVCNRQGEIEESNAALRALLRHDEPALHGTSVLALLADPAQETRLRALLVEPDAARRVLSMELALRASDGEVVTIDANCTPRMSASGRCLGTVVVGRPTAELKRAYQELRSAHEALKRTQQQLLHSEKMASLGRLVAGVAHELNNPISFVLGNVHALGKYGDRLQRYLAAVHEGHDADSLRDLRAQLRIEQLLADLPALIAGTLEGAQRTAAIVNALKRFSARDADEQVVVDLDDVVDRALLWIRKGSAASFEASWSRAGPCRVRANPGQLQQVVMNLLQNAIDAAAGAGRAPEVAIVLRAQGGRALLRITDNGPGIAPQHLTSVFDPFFTTKPVGQGTGLGLSISYGIVEQHRGAMRASNAAGGGACFDVELPLAGAADD